MNWQDDWGPSLQITNAQVLNFYITKQQGLIDLKNKLDKRNFYQYYQVIKCCVIYRDSDSTCWLSHNLNYLTNKIGYSY